MSTTLYQDIRAALTGRLKTLPGLPEVAWENSGFTPKVGVPYLVPVVLMAEGQQAELGPNGRNWERGIYQITANCPLNAGPGALNLLLSTIRDHFKRGTELTYNGLTIRIRKVYLGPPGGASQVINIAFYTQAEN